jgi:hypothetical protein
MFKVGDIVQRNPASPASADPAWYKHTGTIRRIRGPYPGQGDGLIADVEMDDGTMQDGIRCTSLVLANARPLAGE